MAESSKDFPKEEKFESDGEESIEEKYNVREIKPGSGSFVREDLDEEEVKVIEALQEKLDDGVQRAKEGKIREMGEDE